MKNYKKHLFCFILLILFSLTACSSRDDVAGSLTPEGNSRENISGSLTESSQEDSSQENLNMGTVNGGRYENTYFGFGCTLDENWTYVSKEKLLDQIDITLDVLDDKELQEKLRNADMFYDMMAYSNDGYANINVIIQNLGVLYGTIIDEETYINSNLQQLPSQLASAGMEVSLCEAASIEFAGETRQAIRTLSTYQDVDTHQICIVIKRGSYLANITITSFVEDITQEIADLFYVP